MHNSSISYPVIDVFAGPGGLGEGFSSIRNMHDKPRFRISLAIERDEFAYETLFLRHFLQCFPQKEFPDDYYKYLHDRMTRDELYRLHPHEFAMSQYEVRKISLGNETHDLVKNLVKQRLVGVKRWALIGGPPCQAYSLVGRSRMMNDPQFEQDERHFLYREYLKLIIDHRPPVFVMENVKGLLSAKVSGELIITRIIADLSSPKAALDTGTNGLGYHLYSLSHNEKPEGEIDPRLFLVKAEDYGIPQARHRMFIVGIRNDLNVKPRQLQHQKALTVRQMIEDLPTIRSGLTGSHDTFENWLDEIRKLNEMDITSSANSGSSECNVSRIIQKYLNSSTWPISRLSVQYPGKAVTGNSVKDKLIDPRLGVLTGHESRAHMASDLRRYFYAAVFAQVQGQSPNLADFPKELLPNHVNVELGCSGKMFCDRFRVQLPDQVSTTITSHISKDGHYFIHYDPSQCRSLTLREAARLQTFPDNYKFEGPRTAQYHQVGNAVPPYLASQIAEIIAEVLDSIGGKN